MALIFSALLCPRIPPSSFALLHPEPQDHAEIYTTRFSGEYRSDLAGDRSWRAFLRYFISNRECNIELLTRVGDIERSVFRLQAEQPKPIIGEHNMERAQPCTERITRGKNKGGGGGELTTTYCSGARGIIRAGVIIA